MNEYLPFVIAIVGLSIYGVWYWKNKASDYGKYERKDKYYDEGDYDGGDYD